MKDKVLKRKILPKYLKDFIAIDPKVLENTFSNLVEEEYSCDDRMKKVLRLF